MQIAHQGAHREGGIHALPISAQPLSVALALSAVEGVVEDVVPLLIQCLLIPEGLVVIALRKEEALLPVAAAGAPLSAAGGTPS